MTLIKSLENKSKSTVISAFAVISLLLLIPSALISTMLCDIYSAIVFAVLLMICAIPFHCFAKKYNILYFISFLLNSIANGLSVSAYYIHTGQKLDILSMAIAIIPSIIILAIAVLMSNTFKLSKKLTMITSCVFDAVLTISTLVLWIIEKNIIFSFAFFACLVTLFYIMVMGISIDKDKRKVLRDISFGSFGSFVIVTVVVLAIISEGDFIAELSTIGPDSTGNKNKAKNNPILTNKF